MMQYYAGPIKGKCRTLTSGYDGVVGRQIMFPLKITRKARETGDISGLRELQKQQWPRRVKDAERKEPWRCKVTVFSHLQLPTLARG